MFLPNEDSITHAADRHVFRRLKSHRSAPIAGSFPPGVAKRGPRPPRNSKGSVTILPPAARGPDRASPRRGVLRASQRPSSCRLLCL
ncbi:MAG: hypothetical protein ACK55I_28535, partial [bacterium]